MGFFLFITILVSRLIYVVAQLTSIEATLDYLIWGRKNVEGSGEERQGSVAEDADMRSPQ